MTDLYADAASLAQNSSSTAADLAAAQVFATLALVDATRDLADHRATVELAQARAECAALIDVAAAARTARDRMDDLGYEPLAAVYEDLDAALTALDETVGADG